MGLMVFMDAFIQQLLNGLMSGSLYALVALGYTMVYGILRIINFAHGDVLMIGALIGLSVIRLLQAAWPELPAVLALLLATLIAMACCRTSTAGNSGQAACNLSLIHI